MSQRPRSSINSHYFTNDPVSIRDVGSRHNGSKFFTKGDEIIPKNEENSGSLNSLLPLEKSSTTQSSQTSQTLSESTSDSSISGKQSNGSFPSEISSFDNISSIGSSSLNSFNSSNSSNNSNNPDVFTVDGADGSLQVDRSLLRETLQQLKSDSQTPVNQLTPEKTEAFKSVLEALRMLYNNQSAYDIVLGDIRSEFTNITTVKPGTVAAFFIGCFTNDKFTGPVGCSPNCVASVLPANGTSGYAHCDDLVLIYNEGIFSSLNEKRSTHAYIYVGDPHFTGFSDQNITQLKDAGVENASIVFGNSDGTFREVTSVLPLNQLPKHKAVNTEANTKATTDSNSTNTMSSAGGIIVLVIIIIAIAILLYVIYRNNYR